PFGGDRSTGYAHHWFIANSSGDLHSGIDRTYLPFLNDLHLWFSGFFDSIFGIVCDGAKYGTGCFGRWDLPSCFMDWRWRFMVFVVFPGAALLFTPKGNRPATYGSL